MACGQRVRHWVLAAVLAVSMAVAASPGHATVEAPCLQRVLVLAAMPLELHPLLNSATLDAAATVRVDERTFYVGQLADDQVVLAMTGIGMVNAAQATAAALEHFDCGFLGIVFSGVAGSKRSIGDVAIPQRWTRDDGATWVDVDAEMFDVARELEGSDVVALANEVPVGDEACLCPGVETVSTPVAMDHQTQVFVGGDGTSGDTYGDDALPCVPGGGDVFGCTACHEPGSTAADAVYFAQYAPSFADPEFFGGFLTPPEQTTDTYESQDMETAAVAAIAADAGIPFLGIRAVSDGQGDPLNLPGFPAQFFAYRHLAGNNAGATTIAFLERWPRDPVEGPDTVPSPSEDDGGPAPAPTDPDDGPPSLPATGGASAVSALALLATWLLVRRR